MRALVLSGGGVFGAYQAGAWLAIEETGWRPDFIVGTSIGALNGYALSHSATGRELIDLWERLPEEVVSTQGTFPNGPFGGARRALRACVEEIVQCYGRREARFGLHVTMTEVPSCAIRVAPDSSLTEKHLVATCALPGVLSPQCIGGRFYVDGGLFCRLPTRHALEMGAKEVLAVDAIAVHPSPSMRFLVSQMTRLRNFLRKEQTLPSAEQLRGVRVVNIQHGSALGSVRQSLKWNREWVKTWIELGFRDARHAIAQDPAPLGRTVTTSG